MNCDECGNTLETAVSAAAVLDGAESVLDDAGDIV